MSKKVLIVEDNLDTQIYLKVLFNKRNIDIISVFDGSKVIETFNNNIEDISFIMMDLSLPGTKYSGIDFTKIILEIKQIPIIIQTANLDYRKESFESGCAEYITKPFSIYQLFKLIDKYYNF